MRLAHLLALPLAAGLLLGCPSKDDDDDDDDEAGDVVSFASAADFYAAYSELACARLEECSPEAFAKYYSTVDECVDEQMDIYYDYEAVLEECIFNADMAEQCYADVSAATCEEMETDTAYSACNEVFEC